jgi:hypothetical protein
MKFAMAGVFFFTGFCDSIPVLWAYAWTITSVWWWQPLVIAMLGACIGITVAGLTLPWSARIGRTTALWTGVFLELPLALAFLQHWNPHGDLMVFPFFYLPLAMTTLTILIAARWAPKSNGPTT